MTVKESDEVWQDSGTYEDDTATAVGVSLFSTPEIPHFETAAVFGSFEVLGRLARGGMAEVYLARETSDDGSTRHLVLKKVLPDLADDPIFVEMFEAEGKLTTRLYHPNVCHVYECGQIDGIPFLTLEWVWGKSFRDMVRRATRRDGMPVPIAVEIIAQIADALDYIHSAVGVGGKPLGIIHRDVTPHNFMVSWEGHVKLLDFGVAKAANQRTESGQLKGKFGYVSPEQLGEDPLDTRSDLFSLGVCLHEALTGRRLYSRESALATLEAVKLEAPPRVRSIREEVPEDLDQIVLRMLEKDRDERFQTAGDVRDALREHLRATGARVSDVEISEFLNLLYDPSEKVPLPKGSGELTGSFQTLSNTASRSLLAAQDPDEVPTVVGRLKREAVEVIALDEAPAEARAMRGIERQWGVIALVALIVLIASTGAALWFLSLG